MDNKLEIMKKRIQNRNENSLILIGKSKIMGRIANVEFYENLLNEIYLGSIFEICKHCNALSILVLNIFKINNLVRKKYLYQKIPLIHIS